MSSPSRAAATVAVTDTLPAGVTFVSAGGAGWSCGQSGGVVTCTRPSLAVATAPPIAIRVVAAAEQGALTNSVAVGSATLDGNQANNSAAVTTVVGARANLALDKRAPLIAGAGIGGLSAASCLMKAGHQVEIYEQAPVLSEIGAGIQISANARHVLRDLGPEIQWVHSYVTNDKIYCIYRAPNSEMIRQHAEKGGFPANSISEVRAMIDPTTAE